MPEDHPGSQAPKVYPQARKQPRRPTTELPYFLQEQKSKSPPSQKNKQSDLQTQAAKTNRNSFLQKTNA